MYYLGCRIVGEENWSHFAHHTYDYSEEALSVNAFAEEARAEREQQAREMRAASTSERISLPKSEDRVFKAKEKAHIFDSALYTRLHNTMRCCYHRQVVGEAEREMYRALPPDDWRWTTVFKGTTLKANSADRVVIEEQLVSKFGLLAEDVAKTQDGLDRQWRDQIKSKYLPMSKVSWCIAYLIVIRFCINEFVCTYESL